MKTMISIDGMRQLTGIRVMVAAIVSVLMLVLFVSSWDLVASMSFLALFFASWQYINCVSFTRIALALKTAQIEHSRTESSNSSSLDDAATSNPIAASEDLHHHHHHHLQGGQVMISSCGEDRDHLLHGVADSQGLSDPINPIAIDDFDEPAVDREGGLVVLVDPPYSVAIVTIIAINAVIQIVLQATTFSGLHLSLRSACWVFVFVFCGAAGAYIATIIALFGVHTVRFELCRLIDVRR
jgi:hypothetical protein